MSTATANPISAAPVCAGAELLARHRQVWGRKATLRRVYADYFALVRDRCAPLRPVVELGCGPGFLKAAWPEIIATDVVATPWADRVVDATALPFADAGVGNIVAIDVFHHLAAPADFLREARRVLAPGGRIVMLEPWTSLTGFLFYRHIHHEDADRSVDPVHPFAAGKDPMDGNAALPELYFGGRTPRLPDDLRLIELQRLPAWTWLASGGFQPASLLPHWLYPAAAWCERLVAPLTRWADLRALIVIEREGALPA